MIDRPAKMTPLAIHRMRAVGPATLAASLLLDLTSTALASTELEEIVVTARRRDTRLQETPVSVSALSGESLRRSRSYDITDWFNRVPGFAYSDDGWGGHRMTIRGITSGSALEPRPLTAWYLDDTPMMTLSGSSQLGPIGAPRPLAVDLARIEVLRGPQGTLFGASALGGVVRQITNLPELGSLNGWVDVGLSSTAHGGTNSEVNAMLNVPIASKRVAFRLVGFQHTNGGYIDNPARSIGDIDESDTTGARMSVLWQATPGLQLIFRASGQKRSTNGISTTDVNAGDYEQQRLVPERDSESWETYSFTVDYELGRARLTSNTTYVDRQPHLAFDVTSATAGLVGFTIPTTNGFNDGVREFVQEVRVTSAAGERLSWVAGAYYDTQDRAIHQQWISPGFDDATGGLAASFGYPDSPWHADWYSYLRQRALYGELSYEISPAWRVTVGARWFEFTEKLDDYFAGLLAGGENEAHASYRESGVTPRLGIEYRPAEDALIYFNAAQGFRPGGANEFTADVLEACQQDLDALGMSFPPGFESDSLWNFEIGARGRWLDDRLDMSAALYHIDWHDVQTFLLLPSCGAGITENAGGATSNGFELEMAWLVGDSLEFGLSAAYVDASLDEDVPNLAAEASQRIPTVPEWSASGWVRQELNLAGKFAGFWQAEIQHAAGTWNMWDRSTRVWLEPRDVVNLRVGARRGHWESELFAENLLDERGVLFHNLNFLGEWQSLIRPRTVGLRARVRF